MFLGTFSSLTVAGVKYSDLNININNIYVMVMKVVTALVVMWICDVYIDCQLISVANSTCFNDLTCPCCKACLSDGNCDGNCKDGFHGGRCHNHCPENCITCVDALQRDGVSNCTLCKDGYYSTTTLYQCQSKCFANCKTCEGTDRCTSCVDGYFLSASNSCLKCGEVCTRCKSANVCTSCIVGYYHIDGMCSSCNPLCFTCNSSDTCFCSNGCNIQGTEPKDADCVVYINQCSAGCKHNFTTSDLAQAYLCDQCVDGLFGYNCNVSCNSNCKSAKCERLNGTCFSCRDGFYGDFCELGCPKNCSVCDKFGGLCMTCNDGYYGKHCTQPCVGNCQKCSIATGTCFVCSDGFYGHTCNNICSKGCLSRKCNMNTGSCACLPGFMGANCEYQIPTNVTMSIMQLVVTEDPKRYIGPTVGGTLGGIIVISSVAVAIIFVYRRRRTFRFVWNDIDFDSYKLDSRLIDVLEENDEFDPSYFTGKVDETKKPCGKLPINQLAKFVDTHGEDFYQEEFLKLPRGLIKRCDDAKKEENVVKNRYTGIYPYDEHRVRLHPPGSDFINACYIDGYKRKKEYIASLGPTRKAMEGFQLFWRMVWQEKTDVIAMVTNLMEGQSMKCEKYWPDTGASATYGDITVSSQAKKEYAEFVERTFALTKDEEQRTLHHLHYTAWPDKQVPDDVTSLIEFRQKVKACGSTLGGPTIVHCSAGIGRTGTFIALDVLIRQGRKQRSLDIFEYIVRMREQRTSMVQTWQQYQYIHWVLVHALTFHCEPLKESKVHRFMDELSDKKIATLFKQLHMKHEKTNEDEQVARKINRGLEGMNREGADIPGSMHRPFLHMDKKFGENNYINATFVNSYTMKNRFLVCQTPLPDTVKDFITLIIQESCSCIVSMDSPGLKDQTIGEYYPATSQTVYSHPSDMFKVEAQDLDKNPSYNLKRLTIHHYRLSGTTIRTVFHFQCQHWPQGNRLPDVSNFLQLIQDVENMADRDSDRGPIIVHCLNAADRSGLYCAVFNLIEKIRIEQEVSVFNTLRQVKCRRPLAIPNKDQYLFCYRCLDQFVKSRGNHDDETVYSNI